MNALRYRLLPSPIGTLTLIVNDRDALTHILFEDQKPPEGAILDPGCASEAAAQLDQYFAGNRKAFNLELAPQGTAFQKQVWEALLRVGYGETRSYAQIAQGIGKPSAMRAVGSANGSNPIPIVVPCHRIIGANGTLVGYGGGLPIKRKLLEIEGQPSLLAMPGNTKPGKNT